MRSQWIKISLLLAVLFFAGVNLNAQGRGQRPAPPTAEERAKNLDEMAQKLDLSEEQKIKFGEIEEQFFNKTQELRKSADRTTMRDKMMVLREDRNKALKELLSKEQFKQWQAIQEARRQQRGGN